LDDELRVRFTDHCSRVVAEVELVELNDPRSKLLERQSATKVLLEDFFLARHLHECNAAGLRATPARSSRAATPGERGGYAEPTV